MRRSRNSALVRVLQAVGLALLVTLLTALYMRQEKLSQFHMLSLRSKAFIAHTGESQTTAAAATALSPSPPPPSPPPPSPTPPVAALPEPWGSHHMYANPGPYEPCPKEWIEGSWTSTRSQGTFTLPLTLEAQREIYAHQHPQDCSKAKYLVYRVMHNGLGAVFHVTGVALQVALDLDRIFVEAHGTFLASGPECQGNTTLDSCYFLPFSGCRPTEEQMRAAVPLQGSGQVPDAAVVMATHEALVAVRDKAPKRFIERLSKTPMQGSKYYYWWRAQSVAYMLRPNARIREELEKRRKLTAADPQPAPGCISIHVRHGDKGVEAETFEDKVYDITAAKVRALDPARFTDQLWLSTEDPATVEYFVNHTGSAAGTGIKWRTGYTAGVPRKPDRSKPNLQYMQEIGYFEEIMNALLNLDMACECWAFVGSIYSNWVRLIDEFRSTLRCKADAPFADVRYQNPHEMDVNW